MKLRFILLLVLIAVTQTGCLGAMGALGGAAIDRENPWRGATIGGAVGVLGDILINEHNRGHAQPVPSSPSTIGVEPAPRPAQIVHPTTYETKVWDKVWNGRRYEDCQVTVIIAWHGEYNACGYFDRRGIFRPMRCLYR